MPKKYSYPLIPFSKCHALAELVFKNNGSLSVPRCAELLGKKISGPFHNLISSAVKFSLLTHQKGVLKTTEQYHALETSYTDAEKLSLKRGLFFQIPLYAALVQHFNDKSLPDRSLLIKILMKEHHVTPQHAPSVYAIFIKDLHFIEAIIDNHVCFNLDPKLSKQQSSSSETFSTQTPSPVAYSVHISGPSMRTELTISDIEDLKLLDTFFQKIRRDILFGT